MKRIASLVLLSAMVLLFACATSLADGNTAYFRNNSLQTINVGLYDISGTNNTRSFTDGQPTTLAPGGSNRWTAVAVNFDYWWYECPPGMNRTFTGFVCTSPYTFTGTNTPLHGSTLAASAATSVEPINVMNGNVSYSRRDLVIPCPGIPLEFTRSYNSTVDYKSLVGQRWTHTYDWRVTSTNLVELGKTNTYGLLLSPNNGYYWFKKTGSTYQSPLDAPWLLQQITNGTYQVTMPGRAVFSFDTNGILQSMSDLCGNSLTLAYSNSYPTQLLTSVRHSNGQELDFIYSSNLISQVTTPAANLNVYYCFNGQSELTNVTCTIPTASFSESYLYDSATNWANHSLTQIVDKAGNVYSYGYTTNAQGFVTSKGMSMVLSSNYYQHTVSYTTQPYCQSIVNYTRGNTNQYVVYSYDPFFSRVTGIAGPGTINRSVVLDMSGNSVMSVVSDGGNTNTLVSTFDSYRNVTNMTEAFNGTPSNAWALTWNTSWSVVTGVTDPDGGRTALDYTNALISKIKVFYNSTSSYDTILSHTTNGLLSGVTNANGHWEQYYYNAYGCPTSVVPQTGPTVSAEFNQLGYLTKIVLPSDEFDTNDPPQMVMRNTLFDSDELGRMKKITYADGLYEALAWDAVGNVTNYIDRAGRTNCYAYLPTHKLSSLTRQLGSSNLTTSLIYDNQFNTLTIKDTKNRSVECYTMDIQDRPVIITNLEGQTMNVTYGVGSYISKVGRFDGTTVTNTFNSDGLLSNVKYPLTTNQFTYTAAGRPLTLSNEVAVISNSWQQTGWLNSSMTAFKSGPTSTVAYAYFPAGNISNVTSIAGTNTYGCNEAEQVSSITAFRPQLSSPLTFNYSYDSNNGMVSAMTCTNNGLNVNYSFDKLDRVTGISWASTNGASRSFCYSYNNAGMITGIQREDGEFYQYYYDDLDRLTNATCIASGGAVISDEQFAFDEAGNRTSRTVAGVTLSYSYPYGTNGNRLASWAVTQTNLVTQLDVYGSASEPIGTNSRFGQLWVSNSVAVTPSVDGTNFYVYGMAMNLGTQKIVAAIGDVAGNTTFKTNTVTLSIITNGVYRYNAAGCVTNIRYSGIISTRNTGLTWDGKYQLSAISTNGTQCELNGYDALGRRVWTWNGSQTNWMVYDGPHVIAEVNATGALQRAYVYGPGIDNLLAMTVHTGATVKTYFYLTDPLGSVHAIADETGNIIESYRYDAWGRVLGVYNGAGQPLAESTIGNRYLWQGREYSWRTGLYHFRSRWYDPITGRWLSNDPIGISGGLNMYVAFNDNGVNFIDPFGLEVRLMWHEVAVGQYHTFIRITPDDQNAWANSSVFANVDQFGQRYATLGAGPVGGRLVGEFNRPTDASPHTGGMILHDPSGQSEDALIMDLLRSANQYNEDCALDYDLFPHNPEMRRWWLADDGYNSNSYVSGLLRATRIPRPVLPVSVPGWDRPVPTQNFRY